jgi:hypothetical protein
MTSFEAFKALVKLKTGPAAGLTMLSKSKWKN